MRLCRLGHFCICTDTAYASLAYLRIPAMHLWIAWKNSRAFLLQNSRWFGRPDLSRERPPARSIEGQCKPQTVWCCWPFDKRTRVDQPRRRAIREEALPWCLTPVVSCMLRCDAVPFRFASSGISFRFMVQSTGNVRTTSLETACSSIFISIDRHFRAGTCVVD